MLRLTIFFRISVRNSGTQLVISSLMYCWIYYHDCIVSTWSIFKAPRCRRASKKTQDMRAMASTAAVGFLILSSSRNTFVSSARMPSITLRIW